MTKDEARRQGLENRDSTVEEKRIRYSENIAGKISALPEFDRAVNVFLYHSFKSEVITTGLIESTLKLGKRVFLPKVISRTEMKFYEIKDTGGLVISRFGIPEPDGKTVEGYDPDIFIIPLAAYTADGKRAGYGGGYYDRYLAPYKGRVPIVALAYKCQEVRDIDIDENDIAPDIIVNEEEIITASGNRITA